MPHRSFACLSFPCLQFRFPVSAFGSRLIAPLKSLFESVPLAEGYEAVVLQAAIDYIDANRQQVEDEYARIEERIRQGNPEKLEEQLRQNREKLQERLRRKDHQPA